MKKWLTILSLSVYAVIEGAPVGNPAMPKLLREGYFIPSECGGSLRLGYEGDFVSDARMKPLDEENGRIDTYQQYANSGSVTINIMDQVDIYGVFGASRIQADWRFLAENDAIKRVSMETTYRFLWSIGGRAILCNWGEATVGFGGRYMASSMRPDWLTINGAPKSVEESQAKFNEWQLDLDLSYRIDILIPYIGVKYSNAHSSVGPFPEVIAAQEQKTLKMENRTPAGMIVGCSLTTGRLFLLNVEGRFFDEEAITIVGELRF